MYFELMPWYGVDFDALDERKEHYSTVRQCIHKTLTGTADDASRVGYQDAVRVLYSVTRDADALIKEVERLRRVNAELEEKNSHLRRVNAELEDELFWLGL